MKSTQWSMLEWPWRQFAFLMPLFIVCLASISCPAQVGHSQFITLPGNPGNRVQVVSFGKSPATHSSPNLKPKIFPLGPGDFSESIPADYVLDGNQIVAIYNNPGQANSSDFINYWGGPQVVSNDLQVIFWGSWWLTGSGPSANDVINMVQATLQGPYLSELSQYGFQNLNFRKPIIVSTPDAIGNYNATDIGSMIWDHLVGGGIFPEPDNGGRFVYMVFMPPTANDEVAGISGAHTTLHNGDPFDPDVLWFAYSHYGTIDQISTTFSHELVETITDPEEGAWEMDRSIDGGNQIGDVCAVTNDYLGNILVQSYWSQKQRACAISYGTFMPLGVAGQTTSVARTPQRLDTFWVANDGSVWTNWWYANYNNAHWNSPIEIAPAGSAFSHTVAAVARTPTHIDVFWVATDGSVWSNWWDINANNGNWNKPFWIAPAGSSWGDKIAAVSRTPDHLDLFWIGRDGSVDSAWWDQDFNNAVWSAPYTIAPANSALSGMVAAVARTPDHLDVFWVGQDGSVKSNWWDMHSNNGNWNTPFNVAGPGSAVSGAITAVARTPNHLDAFWIAANGAIASNWWDANLNNGKWNTPFNVAGPGSAHVSPRGTMRGAISAVARSQQNVDVFWVAPDESVWTNWWAQNINNNNWNVPSSIAPAGSAYPAVLSAVGRLPNHLDVFWNSPNGAVASNWWDANLNNNNWNTPFNVAGPGSTAP